MLGALIRRLCLSSWTTLHIRNVPVVVAAFTLKRWNVTWLRFFPCETRWNSENFELKLTEMEESLEFSENIWRMRVIDTSPCIKK